MAISLSNVIYHYPNRPEKTVLNVARWQVPTGEQLFVHGPSGAGKSTLLNLLSGLLVPVAGQLEVLGRPLHEMSPRERDRFRADHIGYVFQQFNLIPYLTALENVRLATRFSQKHKGVALQHAIQALFESLNLPEHDWKTPASKLSIGQQQRIAIARALINKPELIIADEPTSALDQANRDAFMNLLMPLVTEHNITLLFISHDVTLAPFFQRSEALLDFNTA